MKFKPGDVVEMPRPFGGNDIGQVHSHASDNTVTGGDTFYWVTFLDYNYYPTSILTCVSEGDMRIHNVRFADNLCDCGAVKLNHPGHSDWCMAYSRHRRLGLCK
jgi:hypothetical protein